MALNEDFQVILEEKQDKLQPDILIKYKSKNLFILEIKTTIGWSRKGDWKEEVDKRIKALSETFEVLDENIVYIFQSPWNMKRDFTKRYLDLKTKKPLPLKDKGIFNKIRPLLTNDDPYYLKKHLTPEEYTDEIINDISKTGIVIPLELTIKEILVASQSDS
jgi:hypothetical protein